MAKIDCRRYMVILRRFAMSSQIPALLLMGIIAGPVTADDLTGIVVDIQDNRVANVGVQLSSVQPGSSEPIVLAETATDDEGEFWVTIPDRWFESPPAFLGELILTAGSGDRFYGGVIVVSGAPFSHYPLTIRLQPWSKRKISLHSNDGKPSTGVKVTLTGLQLPVIYPPEYSQVPMRQLATLVEPRLQSSGVTDEAGMVELLLPPPEHTGSISAEVQQGVFVTWSVVRSYAPDSNQWSESDQWTDALVVPSLRSIPVEATFEDASRARVSVLSRPAMSMATTVTIRQELDLSPDLKASLVIGNDGILLLSDKFADRDNLHVTPAFFQNSATLEKLAVSVGRGVLVRGRVVSSDGEPAAEIRLIAFFNRESTVISTDRDGKFEVMAPSGQLMFLPAGRSGYRAPSMGPESAIVVPAGLATHDVGDIAFTKLSSLNGIVQDTKGAPVASALVTAIWEEPNAATQFRSTIRREAQVRTGVDGAFLIPDLDPQATPRIGAQKGSSATLGLRLLSSDDMDQPVTLELDSDAAIQVTGRVLDRAGNGVTGLEVTLRHRMQPPISDAQLANGADLAEIQMETDSSGKFATPKILAAWGEYVAVIHVGTKQESNSGWKTASLGTPLALPSIEASSSTIVSGHVVASTGSPVSKARVVVLSGAGQSETVTADDGFFSLDLPPGRTPLIIAEAETYLSNGFPIDGEATSLEIVLPDDSSPIAAIERDRGSKKTQRDHQRDDQRDEWTMDRRRELAIKLASDAVDPDEHTSMSLSAAIARYVPDQILPKIDSLAPARSQAGQMIRASLAIGMASDRLDESLRVIDQIPDDRKPILLIQLERSVAIPQEERLRLLARIVQEARGMTQAELRIISLGLAGERLIDLGQRESGEALIRETAEDAGKLSTAAFSGYARGAFAEELAQVDADAALELIEPLTDASSYNRHLQNIAHELASIQPDLAIAILERIRESEETKRLIIDPRDAAALRVCYRMIRVEPDKAIALARSIQHQAIRPYCLVVMIDSLLSQEEVNDSDHQLAVRLHSEAWQLLREVGRDDDLTEVAYLFPSTIAGLLLAQTAVLDRSQVPYRTWQTIALRRPMAPSGHFAFAGFVCTCEMALAIADVDPSRARQVASWLPSPEGGTNQFMVYLQASRGAPQLIAELNPEQCEVALSVVAEKPLNDRLRLGLVQTLLRTDEARSRAKRSNFALWFPDDEDHVPTD